MVSDGKVGVGVVSVSLISSMTCVGDVVVVVDDDVVVVVVVLISTLIFRLEDIIVVVVVLLLGDSAEVADVGLMLEVLLAKV